MSDDRRRYRRVPIRQRCWCEGGNVTLYAQMGDLSEGGAFVRTHAPLAEGARAKVRFALEDGSPIEAEATVVWRRDEGIPGLSPGMGLRFESLEERLREALRELVAEVEVSEGEGES